jgi:hypothetical protein
MMLSHPNHFRNEFASWMVIRESHASAQVSIRESHVSIRGSHVLYALCQNYLVGGSKYINNPAV